MNKLTYSIYYTPNDDHSAFEDNCLDYLCFDKKIHIRFRDFVKEELIIGFEKKLTYLLTYLMNYSYLPKVIGLYNNKTLVDSFLKTDDVQKIINLIRSEIHNPEFKGFKLSNNYRKSECKTFGEIAEGCFPIQVIENVVNIGDLKTFLSVLKVNLYEYLFNDSYIVIIRENKEINYNKKFINKQNKKDAKHSLKNIDIAELW